MLLIMREYCNRYSQQPEEEQEQPQQARQDCLVPPEDAAGLSAFLRLFSQAHPSSCFLPICQTALSLCTSHLSMLVLSLHGFVHDA